MLSRLSPLGLSVLALLASFVIVLTAGGVLATTGNQAPPPPTPAVPKPTPVDIDIAALQAGRDVDVPDGVEPTVTPAAVSGPIAGESMSRLCLTLSDKWSLRNPSGAWQKDGKAYCRLINPRRQPEITIVLETRR